MHTSVELDDLPPPPPGRRGWPWTEATPPVDPGPDAPLITVVTPSFEQGSFIEATIRSVLLQNYPNLEYIVMDGGSRDATVTILEKYDRWISHWVSEPDEGQSDAIQKGMALGSGTLRNWLNADDVLLPGALNALARTWANADTQAVVLCGDSIEIDERGVVLTRSSVKEPAERMVPMSPPLIGGDQASWFFSAEAWERVGGVDTSHRFIMDIDLYYRFAQAGVSFERVGEPLAAYRRHGATKTLNEWEGSIESKRRFFGDILESLSGDERRESERRVRAYMRGLYLASIQPSDPLSMRASKVFKAIREDPQILSKPYQLRRLAGLVVSRRGDRRQAVP